ncbi:Amine oxidase precursor [Bradyrhizobium sp. STM 3843]|nr:FAD-dependent oxidoreductase [Bradyrhizobium sp. STM 3843]CCE10437.1 Amine oxidase precursor [Bradyrhizobium sp. STM 3843]
MSSSYAAVLIVGGGLAGLTVAHLIHRAGIDFRLLEARGRLGGRILSVDESGQASCDGFDLGPSWFWPDVQPSFSRLVDGLGLASFAQQSGGDIVFHRLPLEAPRRFGGVGRASPSMRLVGGTASIVSALAAGLPGGNIELNARVTGAMLDGDDVELSFIDAGGAEQSCRSSQVVFALPPRLLEATVSFTPRIDETSARRWRDTPTWMAPHAKFFALYDRPFWLEKGLSGTAQSMVGPLAEVHDATTASGKAALFGFLGLSAEDRASLGEAAIIASCIQQLALLFDSKTADVRATLFKDWAADLLTATDRDRIAAVHPVADRGPWVGEGWRDRIVLAGSETSARDPGYLAGAVHAAEGAAASLVARLRTTRVGGRASFEGNL